MKYGESLRLYPWVGDYYAQVAGQVRYGVPVQVVLDFLEVRIVSEIKLKQHQQAIMANLTRWANVVQENSEYLAAVAASREPEVCPYCGSLDTEDGVCKWCKNTEIPDHSGREGLKHEFIRA